MAPELRDPVYYWEQDFITEDDIDDILEEINDDEVVDPYFETIEAEAKAKANEFLITTQSKTIDECIKIDLQTQLGTVQKALSYIQSVVGDDEITTTNSLLLGSLVVTLGPVISGILLSPHDLGLNHKAGNYAEEYILTPPHKESSHAAVINRHIRKGVPYVLDIPKLKLLSAVRKQSNKELDFESKYSRVDESASYVHEDWFTYTHHQVAKILATAVFDFRGAKSFPFLGKTEGGCGGKPPFNQNYSIITALHHFNRGKAKESVISIMEESTKIHTGQMKPSQGVFMRAVHAAQIYGVDGLETIHAAMNAIPNATPLEKSEYLDQLVEREPIPPQLTTHEAVILPQDYLLGATISKLRNDGLIMTELDVRMMLAQREKISALKGLVPMRIILEKNKQDILKAKRTAWKIVRDIAGPPDGLFRISVQQKNWLHIIASYFKMKDDISLVTGLSYADMLKVYPAYAVRQVLVQESLSIRDDIVNSLPISHNLKRAFKNRFEEKNLDMAEQWIRSDHLHVLLAKEIPAGIGPDDPRIARKIGMLQRNKTPGTKPNAYIIISNDVAIGMATTTMLNSSRDGKKFCIVAMNIEYYLQHFVLNTKTGKCQDRKKTIPNIFTNEAIRFPVALNANLRRVLESDYGVVVVWDFPNVNRRLSYTMRNGNTIFTFDGGFLRKDTVKNFRGQSGWAHMMMNEVESFDDFNIKKRPESFQGARYKVHMSRTG